MNAMFRPSRSGKRVIAVASGKGGVGKTWFSIMLAHALTRFGRQVLLCDGDLGLANVDVQLGLMPKYDLSALVFGQRSLADCATRYLPGGFSVLAGRSGSGALAALDQAALDRVLTTLETEPAYDTVILDLGTGVDRPVRHMAAWADTLLVIATEEPTSLTDAYAVLKLHTADRAGGDVRVVINQASSPGAGQRTFDILARACATFLGRELPQAGIIRRDEAVRDAIRRQVLLQLHNPDTAAVQDVTRVAAGLLTPTGVTHGLAGRAMP